jgi:hypothetical protein
MKLIFREYSGEMYATSLNGIPKPKRKVSEFIKITKIYSLRLWLCLKLMNAFISP